MNLLKIKVLIKNEFIAKSFKATIGDEEDYITFDFEPLSLEYANEVKVIMSAFTNGSMLVDIYFPGIEINKETYVRVNYYNLVLPFKATLLVEQDVPLLNINHMYMNLSSEEHLVELFNETLHLILVERDYHHVLLPLIEMIKFDF